MTDESEAMYTSESTHMDAEPRTLVWIANITSTPSHLYMLQRASERLATGKEISGS